MVFLSLEGPEVANLSKLEGNKEKGAVPLLLSITNTLNLCPTANGSS